MRPCDVKTFDQQCGLKRDNFDTEHGWILLLADSGEVSITAQVSGAEATGNVHIPRVEFNRMVRWYLRDQKKRKGKR